MKVLMVCLGNICRSPLAEGIFRKIAKEQGLKAEVDSAGTSAYHEGERPDSRSQQVAIKYGIDISNQRARRFTKSDFDSFDKIYVMDRYNYEDVVVLADTPEEEQKVDLILNALHPGGNRAVPDPYYDGHDGFEHVFKLLEDSCEIIVEEMLGQKQGN